MENIRTSPKESSRKDVNSKGIISPILLGEPLTSSDLPPIPIRYRMLLKNNVTCFQDSFFKSTEFSSSKNKGTWPNFQMVEFGILEKNHGWIVFFLSQKRWEFFGQLPIWIDSTGSELCILVKYIQVGFSRQKGGSHFFFWTWDWLKQHLRTWNQKNVLWLFKKNIESHHTINAIDAFRLLEARLKQACKLPIWSYMICLYLPIIHCRFLNHHHHGFGTNE